MLKQCCSHEPCSYTIPPLEFSLRRPLCSTSRYPCQFHASCRIVCCSHEPHSSCLFSACPSSARSRPADLRISLSQLATHSPVLLSNGDILLICALKSIIFSSARCSSSRALVLRHSHPGWSSCFVHVYPVSLSLCASGAILDAAWASESGRLPFALTVELSVEVSRGMAGPDCESGGERSALVRVWMEAFMGVAGLLGSASSGNISSSSADECICESPSTSARGGVVSLRFVRLLVRGEVMGRDKG